MNAIMTSAFAGDQLQRYDAVRRRTAEHAYDRQANYNGRNQKTLGDLEALLTGKKELESQPEKRDFKKLDAGQVKQIALPLGKTLEETVDAWRDVRREAISSPEQTTAEQQLAAAASAKILETEAQIALQERQESQIKLDESHNNADTVRHQIVSLPVASMELPTDTKREELLERKRFTKAISAYSVQVDAKRNGFNVEKPSFYKTA